MHCLCETRTRKRQSGKKEKKNGLGQPGSVFMFGRTFADGEKERERESLASCVFNGLSARFLASFPCELSYVRVRKVQIEFDGH